MALLLAHGTARAQYRLQGSTPAESSGLENGYVDGELAGRVDGAREGRLRDVLLAWNEGFRDGVAATPASEAWRASDAAEMGRRAGLPLGRDRGLAAGREAGRAACAQGWARLQGAPAVPTGAPAPPAGEPPETPMFSACQPPAPIRVAAGPDSAALDLDPSRADTTPVTVGEETVEPPYPTEEWLRNEARRLGFDLGEIVDFWVTSYKRAFRDAYLDAYSRAASELGAGGLARARESGRASGVAEAERRRACAAFTSGHLRGWQEGWVEGFAAGHAEGWAEIDARHASGPVLHVDRFELLDASGDGVIEPGEELTLALVIANAGSADSGEALARWRGIRGVRREGVLTGSVASGARRKEVVALGAVDAKAPVGAAILVDVLPSEALAVQEIRAQVRRPVTIGAASARLEASSRATPRVVVEATLECLATKDVERELHVSSGEAEVVIDRMAAGSTRTIRLEREVTPEAAVQAEVAVEAVLADAAGATWVRRGVAVPVSMESAVAIASSLGSPASVAPALASRLRREAEAAAADPELYARLGSGSELAQWSRAVGALPAPARAALADAVAAPVLAWAEASDAPRPVRRALRDALGAR
jgi:hypothetical protein